jgi:hypothetical protein
MRVNRSIPYILALALLCMRCAMSPVAAGAPGTGSETTNGVVAVVHGRDGVPVGGATVRLRPADFLADSAAAIPVQSRSIIDTTTDSSGAISLLDIDTGTFVLEVVSGDSLIAAHRFAVGRMPGIDTLPAIALRQSATLHGIHIRKTSGAVLTVRAYGLQRYRTPDDTGAFIMPLPPEFDVSLRFQDPALSAAPIDTVMKTSSGDTARIVMGEGSYRSDSMAVAAFLQAQALTDVTVQEVTKSNSGRIYELDLRSRGLTRLDTSVGDLGFLRNILLDSNQLTSLPSTLSDCINCVRLTLSDNAFVQFPEAVFGMPSLVMLHLNANRLTSLPDTIDALSRLQLLYLSGNALSALPPSVFRIPRLGNLDASANALTAIPASVAEAQKLKMLKLQGNSLSAIPPQIGQCVSLRLLVLYGNRLRNLPDSIVLLDSLGTLHLESNLLDSLPADFGALTSLRRLELGNNNLTSLPQSITALKPTNGLKVFGNKLCSLPADIEAWLDMYDNELYGGNTGPAWRDLQHCP